MTDKTRPMSAIEKLAAEIAIIPATRRSKYSVSAYVPWEVIEQLRDEFERLGFDWKAAHKSYLRLTVKTMTEQGTLDPATGKLTAERQQQQRGAA